MTPVVPYNLLVPNLPYIVVCYLSSHLCHRNQRSGSLEIITGNSPADTGASLVV